MSRLLITITAMLNFMLSASGFKVLHAQESGKYIHVLLDRNIGCTGEIVNGYLLFEGLNVTNKVIRVSMYDYPGGKQVFEFFVKAQNNAADFYIPITADLKSGSYVLQFSICAVLNNERRIYHLAHAVLNIINSEKPDLDNTAYYKKCVESNTHLNLVNNFDKNNFKNALTKDSKGEFTLKGVEYDKIKFVYIGESAPKDLNTNSTPITTNETEVNKWSEQIFYEVKLNRKNQSNQINFVGLYSAMAEKMFIAMTDISGKAIFLIDDFQSSHGFDLIGHPEQKVELAPITLSSEDIKDFKICPFSNSTILQSELSDFKKRNLINRYFNVSYFSLINPALMAKYEGIKPQHSYKISNYKKFPNLASFCKENSIPLKFNTYAGTMEAILTPPPRYGKKFDAEWPNPLFIVDGTFEADYQKLAAMKIDDLVQFDIYFDLTEIRKWLNIFGRQGVVKITTKNRDKTTFPVNLHGFLPERTKTDVLLKDFNENNKPLVMPTLLWTTDENALSGAAKLLEKAGALKNKNMIVFFNQGNKTHLISSQL